MKDRFFSLLFKVLLVCLIFAVVATLLQWGLSFVNLTSDPAEWSISDRKAYVIFVPLLTAAFSAAAFGFFTDKE